MSQGELRSVAQVVKEENLLLRAMGSEEYLELAQAVLAEHEDVVKKVKATKKRSKISFLVGQMIRRGEEGRVEAKRAEETVLKLLGL